MSEDWRDPESVYRPWEVEVNGWEDFQTRVNELAYRFTSRELVWRGAQNSSWSLTSSLYRTLQLEYSRPPSEDEMLEAELRMLRLARTDWRFANVPSLELFAHIQHFGGPTRLMDVSENPLVALWFAVERSEQEDRRDGRVFAFAVGGAGVSLDSRWGGRALRWDTYARTGTRLQNEWGTGQKIRYWRPPAYNTRISAQNAGFVIDGVPTAEGNEALCRRSPETQDVWTLKEIKATSSLNVKLSQLERRALSERSTAVFTFRISRPAKAEIRQQLERRYGYRASAMYSDLSWIASNIARNPGLLTGAVH